MTWLYGGDREAMRHDITGCRFTDAEVRATMRRVYDERGYLLDPHSAIAYMGLAGRAGQAGIFLATAHPAKFAEIVDPIVGRAVQKPAPLAHALARPRHLIRIDASLEAVKGTLGA
jgi:threonine synthase